MALTRLDADLNIISKLDNQPNDVGGLSADDLKSKFDQASNTLKDYINTVLIPDIESAIGSGTIAEINGSQLVDASIMAAKLAIASVITEIIADRAITTEKIADGAVTTVKYADRSITGSKIADMSVGMSQIAEKAINTARLNDAAVTAEKMASAAVTEPKIAGKAVTSAKLSDDFNLSVSKGGTGATTAEDARKNLDVSQAYETGTSDLTPGTSDLTTGKMFLVYE